VLLLVPAALAKPLRGVTGDLTHFQVEIVCSTPREARCESFTL